MNSAAFDVIGDIHGHHDKLTALLGRLGYVQQDATWKHPEGRRVLFLGDFIDRGPRIRRVLQLVRGMCDAGDALAVMGNHEYNAVCYHTPDGHGGHLRPRVPKNRQQHAMTLAEFFDRHAEWGEWLAWMKSLPLFLDLGPLRAVHAAWHPPSAAIIPEAGLADPEFLRASSVRGTPEYRAVETLLKGIELPLPDDASYHDKDGHRRRAIRARWWENDTAGRTWRELVFPPSDLPPDKPVAGDILAELPGYAAGEAPVFFGHYWMPAHSLRVPLEDNVACLDFSAAKDGPLVAYRWDGEQQLRPDHFAVADDAG